ncbi:hypothetical protein PLESTM_001572000 [Pleodorina starrii]|nr:hypothetical protein PLESTM_001572000 [Pleodorina starrii]
MSAVDLVDSIIEAAGLAITRCSAEAAARELPWDGYGGLVRICDDDSLREQGVVRAAPRHPRALGLKQQQQQPIPQPLEQQTSQPFSQPAVQPPKAEPHTRPTAGLFGMEPASAVASPMTLSRGSAPLGSAMAGGSLHAPPAVPVPPGATCSPIAAAGGAGGAVQDGAVAGRAAHRRVPSWVQEYVLADAGAGGGGEEDASTSNNGPPARGGGGGIGGGPVATTSLSMGAGGLTGRVVVSGQELVSAPSQPLQPAQPQPPPQQQELHQKLHQLHQLQQIHHQLLQQQRHQTARARSAQKAAGDPDLSWVAQLPSPPANKAVRK